MVTFSDNSVGDMAIYTCDLGFELIGNASTTCTLVDMDSAEFQPAPPSCRRKHIKQIPCNNFGLYVSIIGAFVRTMEPLVLLCIFLYWCGMSLLRSFTNQSAPYVLGSILT